MKTALYCFLFLSSFVWAAKPNVLVIMADDLGYGDLTCMGATDLKTPHIDALFSRGMRFDNFYANCCVCSPTRASLMTGRYPGLAGVPGVIRTHPENNWGWMTPGIPSLPGELKQAGYTTSLIGKWHLGLEGDGHPLEWGFNEFRGYLGDMMDDYYTHLRHGINYMRRGRDEIQPKGHATDLFSQWAIETIDAGAKAEQPWFMFLSYNAPHTPIQPPDDWLKMVTKREAGIDPTRAKLVALIEHMDRGIGDVMAALEVSGQLEETLVIFTSDNGGQCNVGGRNGPLRGCKQDMYEGGIKVATAIAWPGHIEAGSRSSARGITMDLVPTLIEVAGGSLPAGLNGVSLLPVLTDTGASLPERDLYFIRREGGFRYMGEVSWAMRRGDWKLLKNTPTQTWELYNLKDDPLEETNLATKNRGKFNEMAGEMRKHIQLNGAVPWQRPAGE